MEWRGEYQEGDKYTAWFHVEPREFPAWDRRVKAGEAKPEAQLMSEYSQRAAAPADIVIEYHKRMMAVCGASPFVGSLT